MRKTVLLPYNMGVEVQNCLSGINILVYVLTFQVKNEGDDFGWGVVVNFSKKSNVKVSYCTFI